MNIESRTISKNCIEKMTAVVPIIVREVDWRKAPFRKLQALPEGKKPVKQWADRDSAWTNVAKALRKHLESIS
jgi:hypothetical protein